jgi:hypothetical protein
VAKALLPTGAAAEALKPKALKPKEPGRRRPTRRRQQMPSIRLRPAVPQAPRSPRRRCSRLPRDQSGHPEETLSPS